MDKKVKNMLQYGLWIAVAAGLLYFSFRGVNWKDFGAALRECRWGFVVLSMLLGAVAFWLRALRWRMQLLPLDASTARVTTWNAVNVCTLTNYVLPRVGEVVRCGYVVKHSGRDGDGKRLVTFYKALGTVVADRVWDGLSLLAVTLLIFGLLWNRFGTFLTENLFPGLADKGHLWWILALGALAAGRRTGRGRACLPLLAASRPPGLLGQRLGLDPGRLRRHGLLPPYASRLALPPVHGPALGAVLADVGHHPVGPAGHRPGLREPGTGGGACEDRGARDDRRPAADVRRGRELAHFAAGLIFATLSHESQVLTGILCGAESYIHETFFRR